MDPVGFLNKSGGYVSTLLCFDLPAGADLMITTLLYLHQDFRRSGKLKVCVFMVKFLSYCIP